MAAVRGVIKSPLQLFPSRIPVLSPQRSSYHDQEHWIQPPPGVAAATHGDECGDASVPNRRSPDSRSGRCGGGTIRKHTEEGSGGVLAKSLPPARHATLTWSTTTVWGSTSPSEAAGVGIDSPVMYKCICSKINLFAAW